MEVSAEDFLLLENPNTNLLESGIGPGFWEQN